MFHQNLRLPLTHHPLQPQGSQSHPALRLQGGHRKLERQHMKQQGIASSLVEAKVNPAQWPLYASSSMIGRCQAPSSPWPRLGQSDAVLEQGSGKNMVLHLVPELEEPKAVGHRSDRSLADAAWSLCELSLLQKDLPVAQFGFLG